LVVGGGRKPGFIVPPRTKGKGPKKHKGGFIEPMEKKALKRRRTETWNNKLIETEKGGDLHRPEILNRPAETGGVEGGGWGNNPIKNDAIIPHWELGSTKKKHFEEREGNSLSKSRSALRKTRDKGTWNAVS